MSPLYFPQCFAIGSNWQTLPRKCALSVRADRASPHRQNKKAKKDRNANKSIPNAYQGDLSQLKCFQNMDEFKLMAAQGSNNQEIDISSLEYTRRNPFPFSYVPHTNNDEKMCREYIYHECLYLKGLLMAIAYSIIWGLFLFHRTIK